MGKSTVLPFRVRREAGEGFECFQGASYLILDDKGRLTVPKRHRDVLDANAGSRLTVTRHPDGCLMVLGRSQWEQLVPRIAALPTEARWWKRTLLGYAMDVDMDATGRVLISPELRSAATISREVVLLGMGGYLELWDKATHDAQEAQALKGEMPDVLKEFIF